MLLTIDINISMLEMEINSYSHFDLSEELKKEAADKVLNDKIKEVLNAENRELTPVWNEWKSFKVSEETWIIFRRSVWLLVNDPEKAKKGDHVRFCYPIPEEETEVVIASIKNGRIENHRFVRVWENIFELAST